ncbi:hypothetical protein E4U55_008063 [Claviceps digitariae]|nr:hypothetical protein E4U55_008063 [Claviceps digitariae]
MDSQTRIISNLIDVVGCNGLRHLADLGFMRLDTIRGRVSNVEKKLSRPSIISIFIAWLQAKALQVDLEALPLEEWCRHLSFAYGCTESEVLRYWDSSERKIWGHLSDPSSLPDVQRRMGDVCRAVRQVYARDGDASVCVSVRGESQRQGQLSCGASSWRPSDDPRRGPTVGASRGDRRDGGHLRDTTPKSKPEAARLSHSSEVLRPHDRRDNSSGCLANKTDWDARSASSAKRSSLITSFAYPRGINPGRATSQCPADSGLLRDHIHPDRALGLWACTEQISPRHQTTVDTKKLPADAEMKDDDQKMQEKQETDATSGYPGRHDHFSVENTSKRRLRVAPQTRLQKRDIQDDASPQKPDQQMGLALRSSGESRISWASNHDSASSRLSSDDHVESSLSLETKYFKSPVRNTHAQDATQMSSLTEDKRGECQLNAKAVAMEVKELSAADEVALQRADEFLGRLERALKRKYQSEIEGDLMFWDNDLRSKRPTIGAADHHDGVDAASHVSFFGADADGDAACVPCSAGGTRSECPESEAPRLFCDRMTDKPHAQDLLPGLSWGHTVQEPRHSAMELWQAGIEFKVGETSEDDG